MRPKRNPRVNPLLEILPKGAAVPYTLVVREDAGEWLASCPELLINTRKATEKKAVTSCLVAVRKRLFKDAQTLLRNVKILANPDKRKEVLEIIRVHD